MEKVWVALILLFYNGSVQPISSAIYFRTELDCSRYIHRRVEKIPEHIEYSSYCMQVYEQQKI